MPTYLVTVHWLQPYPKQKEFRIAASSVSVAASRGLKQWKSEVGRKRYDALTVKIQRL